ncbi:arylacetamide deacetylase-like 3 [Orycteropus afer afer]|uniref:Arylacetamide deacetylase-like 3 n=1 Tax=Orycteropus afer afer TaxID=1230840 RepID=A0A8B6ZYU7_ORYAF|nr:arylacetamide deacetylase-like 3 [Orycteropus afer afer]
MASLRRNIMLFLVSIFLVTACVLASGVALYVTCYNLLIADFPAAIGHPVKLRVLYCLFLLLQTWGKIFETLRICSMPRFVRFMHDLMPLKTDPDVLVTDLRFGTISLKLYQPKASSLTLKPGVVFYHGGGMVFGSLKTHHGICTRLCKESDSVVLAVGYRMLPDHKFPVLKTDCFAATIYFLKSLKAYGVDPTRVVVCGDSVGGGIAALACQELRRRVDLPKIRAQILVYTFLQGLDFQLPSYQQNKNVPLLTRQFAFYCWSHYLDISPSWESTILKGAHLPVKIWEKYRKWLGPENIPERFKQRGYQQMSCVPVNEAAYLESSLVLDMVPSPLIAEDDVVAQVPEACIVTCEYDLLRDDSLLYKKRLEDLGVPVTWHHMEDGFHGVLNTIDMGFLYFPCSTRILNVMANFIKGL